MGNKQTKSLHEQSFIGDTLLRRADEINRLKFMIGPVMEKLKMAAQQGIYSVDVTKEEMGSIGIKILTEEKLLVEETHTGYRIYIRKL